MGPHPLDPRVWSLLVTGVVVVMVPLLLFTALAGQIGAARRDRRSATLRLLGASTNRLRLLVAGEAFIAAVAGVVLAVSGYLLARPVAQQVQFGGRGLQLSDVAPAAGWTVAILLGVPFVTVTVTFAGLSGTVDGGLGGSNRTRRGPRAGWRVALAIVAIAVIWWAGWRRYHYIGYGYSVTDTAVMCLVVALSLFAVAASVGLITDRIARRWVGHSVAGLLGRRRIVQDGSVTTRAATGLTTVLTGFIILMTLLSGSHYDDQQAQTSHPIVHLGSVPYLDSGEWDRLQRWMNSVPGVQSAYLITSLAASTTGDRPVVVVATCPAIEAMTVEKHCSDGDSFRVDFAGVALPAPPYQLRFNSGQTRTWNPPGNIRPVNRAVPSEQTGYLSPTDYVLTPAAVQRQFPGLLQLQSWVQVAAVLPASSADGVQRAVSWLGWRGYGVISLSATTGLDASPVPWIRTGLIGCGLLTLLICALGQWLMGAEQISERRRAFALARASGVPLSVLARSMLHSALLPVAIGIGLAATTGAVLAPYIEYLRGALWVPPSWPWVVTGSAVAVAVAVIVAVGSMLGLRATTGPGALRTE